MTVLIKNGRVIDPANNIDAPKDVLIDKGKIKAVESPGKISTGDLKKSSTIDAKDCVVCPGFIDMHVHFREPGFEYKANRPSYNDSGRNKKHGSMCRLLP